MVPRASGDGDGALTGRPAVSVLLPVHDGDAGLIRAARSVLRQTFRDLELVCVDDASTDATPGHLRALARSDRRVRVVTLRRNLGIVGALNRGLAAARGALIARIDHDDEWTARDKLTRQVALFRRDPGLVLVGTGVREVDDAGRPRGIERPPADDAGLRRRMLSRNPFAHASVVFRRSAVGGGGYPARPAHVEDYHLWLALGARGRFAAIPDACVRLARRGAGISARHRWTQFGGRVALALRFAPRYPGRLRAVAVLAWDGCRILAGAVRRGMGA